MNSEYSQLIKLILSEAGYVLEGKMYVNHKTEKAYAASIFENISQPPQPTDPEAICNNCGGENPLWSADNDLWNKVNASPNGILCPICFIKKANHLGVSMFNIQPAKPQQSASPTIQRSDVVERKEEVIAIIADALYNIRSANQTPLMDTGKCDEIAEFIYTDIVREYSLFNPSGKQPAPSMRWVKASERLPEPYRQKYIKNGANWDLGHYDSEKDDFCCIGGYTGMRKELIQWLDDQSPSGSK